MPKYNEEARKLFPYLLPLFRRAVGGGGGGGGGTTIIGGGLTPHALNSSYHTGLLSWSQLSKANSNLFELETRPHSALTNIGPNDHHSRIHNIISGDGSGAVHTITGSAFQLVGATGTNTLGLLTPTAEPGAAAAILRTDSNGSFAFDTDLVTVDAVNNRVGVNRAPGAAALDVLAESDADHTLRVKQKTGQTGRLWRVEDDDGNELIILDSQGNLQSGRPGFFSGLTGWQITPQGNAEFNNIWARGELHATVFVKDEVHATGGTFFVATAAKLYSDAVIDTTTTDTVFLEIETTVEGFGDYLEIETTVGSFGDYLEVEALLNYIETEDPASGPAFYFQPGDVVRSKTEVDTGVTDFWFEIVGGRQLDGFARYSVLKRSGTDGTLPAGSALVSYGVEGDGRILMTSDLNYAPYIDVFTVGPEVWTGNAGAIIPHVRLGRLDGVGVTATSGIEQYGMIVGTDLSDANSPYIVASDLQLRLHKVDLTLNDGENDTGAWDSRGNLTIGTNIGVDAGKSFQVITTGDDAGDLIVGQLANNYVAWDHSAATLTIQGSFKLGDGPTNSLVVGENGFIRSSNVATFNDWSSNIDSGFWLGWDEGDGLHKFRVGKQSGNALTIDEGEGFEVWGFRIYTEYGLTIYNYNYGEDGTLFRIYDEFLSPHIIALDGNTMEFSDTVRAASLISEGRIRVASGNAPFSSGADGATGDIAWDSNYLYIATATDTWKRIALSSF